MSQMRQSLLQWINTFTLDNIPHQTLYDVSDGIVFAHVLSQICPEYFNEDWLSKIKGEVSPNNWMLRLSNLKKVQKGILDYYTDSLEVQISPSFRMPDLNMIAKDFNGDEIGKLIQLLLGCAVNCQRKDTFIAAIMGLREDVQVSVMKAIQELEFLQHGAPSLPVISLDPNQQLNEQLKRVTDELKQSEMAKDLASQTIFEQHKEIQLLKEQKSVLQQENDRLAETLTKTSPKRDIHSSSEKYELSDASIQYNKHAAKLQTKIETLQDELFKLDTIKDDYRLKIDILEKELLDLRLKNEDLQRQANEAKILRDEIDILRHLSEKAEKYEQINENYKKKLEEMSDIKRQQKLFEEKYAKQMKHNSELEEELKRTSTFKAQIDLYKKQVQDAHTQFIGQTHRADTFEYELNHLKEKHESILAEKEMLILEKNKLRLALEEKKGRSNSYIDEVEAITLTAKEHQCLINELQDEKLDPIVLKAKLSNMEKELKEYKIKDAEYEAEKSFHQSKLETVQKRLFEAENEIRQANQIILKLESQIEEVNSSGGQIKDLNESNDLEKDLKQKRKLIDRLTKDLYEYQQKICDLEGVIVKKEDEMSEMANRHKKYVTKAKQVVNVIEPLSLQCQASSLSSGSIPRTDTMSAPNINTINSNDGTVQSIETLRLSCEEKEKLISNLETGAMESKALRELEEKLMSVAVHNLAAHLQRKTAEERLSGKISIAGQSLGPSSGSFLTRQRQATTRKFNTPGVSPKLWRY